MRQRTDGNCRDTQSISAEPCDPTNRPVAAAPAPAPKAVVVAAAPPASPAAIPQPEPAKPLPQRLSFSADALFAFDRSELKPEGKVMLDDLVRQLNSATYDVISATGHTDRFGSNEYNQKLSERRANAVKEYLVSKDILASRINAEGKGETQPITKAGECTGAKSTRVIACLQPERRVDVEMHGARTITNFDDAGILVVRVSAKNTERRNYGGFPFSSQRSLSACRTAM